MSNKEGAVFSAAVAWGDASSESVTTEDEKQDDMIPENITTEMIVLEFTYK